jgi:hypothetical protein
MKSVLACCGFLAALAVTPLAAEEVYFKSPGPGMRFTAGLPVVVWADVLPRDEQAGFPHVECYWDEVLAATATNVVGAYDYFPLTVPAAMATPGEHVLKLRAFFRSGAIRETSMSVRIDPWPTNMTAPCTTPGQQFCVVELTADTTVANLDWTNVAVRGHGHRLTVSGSLTIRDSLVTGLGSLSGVGDPYTAVMVNGITGTLTGNVDVHGSTFESTGAVVLTLNGTGSVSLRQNEFRASNFIRFVPSDPDASPVLRFTGSNQTRKLFQGNRVAAGRVVFAGMANWLIGADVDQNEANGNILMGPRCTINVTESSNVVIRGNYSYHNYRGEWSQGFNLVLTSSASDLLTEHNLIRAGSWPVEGLSGEFRYNLQVGYGHEWIRMLHSNARVHHNVLVPEGGGGLGAGIWAYLPYFLPTATNIQIYNNTMDGGALTGDFAGAFVEIANPLITVSSLRNNLFTYARNVGNGSPGNPLVMATDNSLLYADYNAFYSPNSSQVENYAAVVPGHAEGEPGYAGHDVSGTGALGVVNGRLAAHPFAGLRDFPYSIDEAAVWNRQIRLSQVLATFRLRYRPRAGSPVIDAGDVADNDALGRRTDIGAIDRDGHDQDRFGRYGSPGSVLSNDAGGLPRSGTPVRGIGTEAPSWSAGRPPGRPGPAGFGILLSPAAAATRWPGARVPVDRAPAACRRRGSSHRLVHPPAQALAMADGIAIATPTTAEVAMPHTRIDVQRILCPVDFTDVSARALEHAVRLASLRCST